MIVFDYQMGENRYMYSSTLLYKATPILWKATPLIKPGFRCTEIVKCNWINPLKSDLPSYLTTYSLQNHRLIRKGRLLLFIFIHLSVILWQVEVKLIGPFVCNGRMKHVMVFMDVFSLWPEAAIVETMSSTVVTHVIINLICRLVYKVLQH